MKISISTLRSIGFDVHVSDDDIDILPISNKMPDDLIDELQKLDCSSTTIDSVLCLIHDDSIISAIKEATAKYK